jgi:uncharacterized protein YrrD
MLRNLKSLQNRTIAATDGNVGEVKDFYFDDAAWVIRYLVVATGNWLSGRKVLISPIAVEPSNWNAKLLTASLTMEQVKHSPDIDTDKPVSRQNEIGYLGYYGYPYYWGGSGLWGRGEYPAEMQSVVRAEVDVDSGLYDDPNLRSCDLVATYRIHATDGDIGHVQGFLIDDKSWAIRYMVVNTGNWWMGHQILVSPEWIDEVSWSQSKVSIDLTREQIRTAPTYDPDAELNRPLEAGLHTHYGRSGYWIPAVRPRAGDARTRV